MNYRVETAPGMFFFLSKRWWAESIQLFWGGVVFFPNLTLYTMERAVIFLLFGAVLEELCINSPFGIMIFVAMVRSGSIVHLVLSILLHIII